MAPPSMLRKGRVRFLGGVETQMKRKGEEKRREERREEKKKKKNTIPELKLKD